MSHLLQNACLKFRLRHVLFLSLAWYLLSPAVRRTADTAEWCGTGCTALIPFTNGLRVAAYSLEAAFSQTPDKIVPLSLCWLVWWDVTFVCMYSVKICE